jgi:hypothetical protein
MHIELKFRLINESSSLGGVTIGTLNNIRGSLQLIYRVQRTRLLNSTTSGKKITRSKRQPYFNQLIDKRNATHKKNANTVRDRNTTADNAETGADGDDDNEEGKSEEGGSEHEDEDGEGERGQRECNTEVPLTQTPLHVMKHHVQGFPSSVVWGS